MKEHIKDNVDKTRKEFKQSKERFTTYYGVDSTKIKIRLKKREKTFSMF